MSPVCSEAWALPLTLALGHEGHHVECNETAINAMKADIQAMG